MLQNPIYLLNYLDTLPCNSNNTPPVLKSYPRIADSQDFNLEPKKELRTQPTPITVPHSPYSLGMIPPKA